MALLEKCVPRRPEEMGWVPSTNTKVECGCVYVQLLLRAYVRGQGQDPFGPPSSQPSQVLNSRFIERPASKN